MSRILVLGKTGFGKTTSYSGRKKFGIKGLNPKETFVIQCTNRGVANPDFKLVTPEVANLIKGNRMQVSQISGLDRFKKVAELIEALSVPESPFKNIVVDDFNYLAQDFYMANAMKGGWDTPKQIGYGMGLIFDSFKGCPENKNIICCAHYEEYKDKITSKDIEEYDFLHLVLEPEKLTKQQFYREYYKLVIRLYNLAKKSGIYDFMDIKFYKNMLTSYVKRKMRAF